MIKKTWGKNELKKFLVQLGFSSKIKVPQLGSARNLHNSAWLEPENFSSGSSLNSIYHIPKTKVGRYLQNFQKNWTSFMELP